MMGFTNNLNHSPMTRGLVIFFIVAFFLMPFPVLTTGPSEEMVLNAKLCHAYKLATGVGVLSCLTAYFRPSSNVVRGFLALSIATLACSVFWATATMISADSIPEFLEMMASRTVLWWW
jgi:hypothetical protein